MHLLSFPTVDLNLSKHGMGSDLIAISERAGLLTWSSLRTKGPRSARCWISTRSKTFTTWMKPDCSTDCRSVLLNVYKLGWRVIPGADMLNCTQIFQADHSLATEQLEGRKQHKEHLTFAVCCNGDGSDKLLLWIIGKSKSPRRFKNLNLNNLGCISRNNSKAWMTQIMFLEWPKVFEQMAARKVLLIS